MAQQSSEQPPSAREIHVKDMKQFGNPFYEFLYNLKTSRWYQISSLIGVIILLVGGYWLFIYVEEYNPQNVGGKQCKFSDDPSTRMTSGELILRGTGKGIISSDTLELEPGEYEIAYRFRPWSMNSSSISVEVRPTDDGRIYFFHTELTKPIWHAGMGTFETDGGEYYVKVAYVEQPWCFELAKVG